MSEIHVVRIKKKLEEIFSDLIDLSDIQTQKQEIKEMSFLSRAQAALVLSHFAEISNDVAATSITDGYNDNGIDVIYIDKVFKNLYIVQSKWDSKGSKGPELGDALKFTKGFKDLINCDFSHFNEKIKAKKDEIESAISDPDYHFIILLTYTSNQNISSEINDVLNALLHTFNDSSEVLRIEIYNQKRIYNAILVGSEGEPINIEGINLYNWGKHASPYVSYYGEVDVSVIGEWWNNFGTRLFAKNIRQFKGSTEVNDGIKRTLLDSPSDFWYFNNGITILCNKIKKGLKNALDREIGMFNIYGISVVNGAQTIGSIGGALNQTTKEISGARVQIRLINLEDTPEDYAQKVTKYNNTQNKIENRDFLALDPVQERIQKDLWLDNKIYTYKSGEKTNSGSESVDIEEATIALACAHSNMNYSVQAKNEIGKLWDDINRPPYKHLFNSKTSGLRVWRSVQVLRTVEQVLSSKRNKLPENKGILTIHCNRFILYKVFRLLKTGEFDEPSLDFREVMLEAQKLTEELFDSILKVMDETFPDAYYYNFFKRKINCEKLSIEIDKSLNIGQTQLDFE